MESTFTLEARLDLSDIRNDPLKFEKAIQHMGTLHKRYRFEVKKSYRENPKHARPPHHTDDKDWRKIMMMWDEELYEEKVNANENNGWNHMVERQRVALEAGNPISTFDILDEIIRAHTRSDYRPDRGYGPVAIGTSQQIWVTMVQLMEALEASKTRERDVGTQLVQTRTKLTETQTKLTDT